MLQAGFARIDITPPFGNDLSGYYERRLADGTLDPLYLNAVALTVGDETVILMAADYIGIKMDQCAKIREMISERTGVPTDHILIAALHQHTSPCLADPTKRETALRDTIFIDVVRRRFADAAVMALDDRADAEMSVAAREVAEPIAFVRRYFTREAGVVTNPSSKFTLTGRCADADNTVRLVRFARKDKNDIAILNFSTHPDVIGGTKFSADWPGFIRRFTEKALPGVKCAVFNGAQGDTNHINVFGDKKTKGYHHSEFMGRTVTDTVLRIWDRTEPCEMGTVHSGVEMVYVPTNTKDMDRMEEYIQLKKDHQEGKVKLIGAELAQISRVCSLPNEKLFQKVPVSVLVLGKLGFVGFGGEPFTHYAAAAREAAPKLHVITCCCVNGGEGYLPDGSAYTDGGYEVCNSRFDASVADLLQASAKKMLDAYQEEK
jgi:hypothetical protein